MEIALETPFRLPRPLRAATMRAVSTNELTDAELILRTGDGDRGAFEVLYRRYSRPVFGLALRRLGDRGRAEDAVQETFASIWRAARTYKPERGPGGPWSTRSRGTRSSTAAAPAARRRSRRPRRSRSPTARPSRPRRTGSPGASTARSRS
jgi:RNA polymerase sigma-70 factor, ECF subfamily